MPTRFHIANVPIDAPLEELARYFEPYGTVLEVDRLVMKNSGSPRDAVHISLELTEPEAEQALLQELNGMRFGDQVLYVSPNKPPKQVPVFDDDTKKEMGRVCKILDESEAQPRNQIRRMIQLCGVPFVNLLLAETQWVEENGGLLVKDGSRRRTTGGVFFSLARNRISSRMQRVVFYKPKPKAEGEEEVQAPTKPISKPSSRPSKPQAILPQMQGKPKKADKGKPAAAPLKDIKKPPKPQPLPTPPASDPVALANARLELDDLRRAYAEAQKQLESLKTLPANERKSGLFSATREVVNLQKQMAALIKQYPELNE